MMLLRIIFFYFIRTVASVFNYYTNYTVPLPPVPSSTLLIPSSEGLSQNELEYHLIDIFAIVVISTAIFHFKNITSQFRYDKEKLMYKLL